MHSKVFISHSNEDKSIADAICQRLESDGIKCWIAPRDIKPGSTWTKGIMQGIDDCRILILVFSEHANDSDHVYREVARAFSSRLAVIPFRIKAVLPSQSLSYFLDTVHWLNAVEPPLQRHLDTLTERVKSLLAGQDDTGGSVTEPPAGVKSIGPPGIPGFVSGKKKNWFVRMGVAASCLVVITALWLFIANSRKTTEADLEPSATVVPAKSIAVLPFESLSENKSDSYFADGIQDEILNNLAKIAQLRVISRTSVMQYRSDGKRDLRQIAKALGVAKILEGTVRRDGNHVRVSTELVDARNDNTIWADSYDRDLNDIFAIQSEVAQTIANKLTATISPEEKKRIEEKPTENLEAYDLYLQAKLLVGDVKLNYIFGNFEQKLRSSVDLLQRAVQLDPKFTLAYCASAEAHDLLYLYYDPTSERRAFGDAAMNNALRLQSELPEVHLAYAFHLYRTYHDYEQARVQLTIARRGLPNDAEAIVLQAYIDRREGNFQKAIQEFNEALTRDPRNTISLEELAFTLHDTRQFRAAEQVYDRLIGLEPDQPILKVQKASMISFMETGDVAALRAAIAALPASLADDRAVLSQRLALALVDRDGQQARQLIEKMTGGEDDTSFSYVAAPVPIDCYSLLLARLEGGQPDANSSFAGTRERLSQKLKMSPESAEMLSNLAVVDALLGKKAEATTEARRAAEMLPISKDALNGPGIVINLAVVYAWTNELDLAFETLAPLAKIPNGIYYGQLKREPYWEPLRQDPRYEKMLAELAPRE